MVKMDDGGRRRGGDSGSVKGVRNDEEGNEKQGDI